MKLFESSTKYAVMIVLAVCTISLLCLLVFSINFGNNESKRPRVDWELNKLPDESNRIYHPCGISIISPSGWTPSFSAADNKEYHGLYLIGISPHSPSLIKIFEYHIPSYPDKIKNDPTYKPIIFKNLPALEKLDIKKSNNETGTPSTVTGKRYFLRGNHCYCIVYSFQFYDTVPVNLSLYLDSFAFQKK
ncbi:MAG: hypothetical protein LBF88_04585 [Planctomycetaceae bacterium]|jgi:hypothetical protein|nr:hypothetical protein [Planctomycetaceae bacterium]